MPLTVPFSFPQCTQSQPSHCPAGHLSAVGTCARECPGILAFPTFIWAMAGGPRPILAATLSFVCSLCPMCGVLCQGLGIQQRMRPSDIIPLKKTDEKQISETWQVWEGGKSYGGKAGCGSGGEFWRRGVLRGLQGRPP